jgi:hypothetical protein
MRTTVDLPDELLRQAKARAALDGVKLKDLIARYVEEGLRGRTPPLAETAQTTRRRRPPPVIIPARGVPIQALTGDESRDLETAEDEARHARSA